MISITNERRHCAIKKIDLRFNPFDRVEILEIDYCNNRGALKAYGDSIVCIRWGNETWSSDIGKATFK